MNMSAMWYRGLSICDYLVRTEGGGVVEQGIPDSKSVEFELKMVELEPH